MTEPKSQKPGEAKRGSTDSGDRLEAFVLATINEGVSLGGKQVSDEHWKARVEICYGCELAGTVEIPLPGKKITTDGCTECGCPFLTKPKWEKYFSWRRLRIIKAECPHPTEGNKWADVDKHFLTTKSS